MIATRDGNFASKDRLTDFLFTPASYPSTSLTTLLFSYELCTVAQPSRTSPSELERQRQALNFFSGQYQLVLQQFHFDCWREQWPIDSIFAISYR